MELQSFQKLSFQPKVQTDSLVLTDNKEDHVIGSYSL